jgi:hypothetical protein
MSNKEIILVVASILFLVVAVYTINKISKLNVSKSYKVALYYITIVIPILGLFLVLMAKKKSTA